MSEIVDLTFTDDEAGLRSNLAPSIPGGIVSGVEQTVKSEDVNFDFEIEHNNSTIESMFLASFEPATKSKYRNYETESNPFKSNRSHHNHQRLVEASFDSDQGQSSSYHVHPHLAIQDSWNQRKDDSKEGEGLIINKQPSKRKRSEIGTESMDNFANLDRCSSDRTNRYDMKQRDNANDGFQQASTSSIRHLGTPKVALDSRPALRNRAQRSKSYVTNREESVDESSYMGRTQERRIEPPVPTVRIESGMERRRSRGRRSLHHEDNGSGVQRRDPLFYKDPLLTPLEMEVLWLGVESIYCSPNPDEKYFQWDFIWDHASNGLRSELSKLPNIRQWKTNAQQSQADEAERLRALIRADDWLIKKRFDTLRGNLLVGMVSGFRRPLMARVIAELSLQHRMRQNVDD